MQAIRRLRRQESGFTLPEMLVTILIMVIVLFALYSIFDQTLRIFALGNQRTNAVQNARVAMERMEREIRMAYPRESGGSNSAILNVKKTNNDIPWFGVTTSTGYYTDRHRIVFGNDINGDGEVAEVGDNPAESPAYMDEVIMYWDTGHNQLKRCYRCDQVVYANPIPSPPLAYFGPTGSMEFRYFKNNGQTPIDCADDLSGQPSSGCVGEGSIPQAEEQKIDMVRIVVKIDTGGPGKPVLQTLSTDVSLRNRI